VAYIPETWVDRNVQYPNRYTMVDNGDGTYTLIPSPGTVTEAGTFVTAQHMNNIEQGIVDLDGNKIPLAQRAAANGVATLDSSTNVPSAQLGNVIAAINTEAITWELLATKVFTESGTAFNFTGIPSTYKRFKILALITPVTNAVLWVRLNSITTQYSYVNRVNGTITAGNNQDAFNIAAEATTYSYGYPTMVEMDIANYPSQKTSLVAKGYNHANLVDFAGINYGDAAKISSLYFGGSFNMGSEIILLGSVV